MFQNELINTSQLSVPYYNYANLLSLEIWQP